MTSAETKRHADLPDAFIDCRECGEKLEGRRRLWCSDDCVKVYADRHGAAVLREAADRLTMKFVDDEGDHEIPKRDVDAVRNHLRAAADHLEG